MSKPSATAPTFRPNLRRTAASNYLRDKYGITLSASSLAKMAVQGGGPPYYKDGRFPVYNPDRLDEYAMQRLGKLRTSTSDVVA